MGSGVFSAHASLDGSWKFHPAVNMTNTVSHADVPAHVLKIMNTGKYAYFVIHSTSYHSKDVLETSHSTARPLLFRAENSEVTSEALPVNVRPMCQIMETGGIYVTAAEYNPEGGYIAVGYDNSNIDLIYDNGEISTIRDLNKVVPANGKAEITSFSFERGTNRIWAATRFGFVTIDSESKTITGTASLGRSVYYVSKVGESVIATTSDGLIEGSGIRKNWKPSDFKNVSIDMERSTFYKDSQNAASDTTLFHKTTRALIQCTFLYALGENTFFTARTQNIGQQQGGTGTINGLIIERSRDDSGKWVARYLENIGVRWTYPYFFPHYLAEHVFGVHAGGMHYFTGTRYVAIKDNGSLDLSETDPITKFTKNYRESIDLKTKANRPAGTGDGINFWFYEPFQGFEMGAYDRTAKSYKKLCASSMPELPSVALAVAMKWHPRYGMLVRQHGNEPICDDGTPPTDYDLICGYKDGKWTDYSIVRRTPELKESFKGGEGIEIDPDDDRYIYAGSKFSGILRLNLDDPQDIIHMSRDTDPASDLKGYVNFVPECGWKNLVSFACPRFDGYGNLWSQRWTFETQVKTEFWYWKPEDRRASTSAETFRPWGKIRVAEIPRCPSRPFITMIHPASRNFLAAIPEQYDEPLIIYDFNGTPEDVSDDRLATTEGCYSKNGVTLPFHHFQSMAEDPLTGDLWLGTDSGLYTVNPTNLLNGTKVLSNLEPTLNGEKIPGVNPLDGISVKTIEIDGQNRKWIGTANNGILCLSADGTQILGEYTKSNSGLMSNDIIGLKWNPENQSMMISSMAGLQEFTPYATSKEMSAEEFSVFPSRIEPAYDGWITLRGVNDSARLQLRDGNGMVLRTLTSPSDGRLQFTVRDTDGTRLPAGELSITDTSGKVYGTFLMID